MNTKVTDSNPKDEENFSSANLSKAVDSDEKVIESLNDKIVQLEQENRRVKFLTSLIILILLDFMMFQQIANWAGALVIGIFQLVLLLFIGKILGIEDLDHLLTRILNAFTRSLPENPPK